MREKYKESVKDREREGERVEKVVISMGGLHLLHCQSNFFDNPVN